MTSISGKELARALERHGWVCLRISGSHHIYGKPGQIERISIPIHGSTPLKQGLLNHMLKAAGLSLGDIK